MRTLTWPCWVWTLGSLVFFSTAALRADTFRWNPMGGGSGDQAWNNAANWDPSTESPPPPGFPTFAGDIANLLQPPDSHQTIFLNTAITVGQICFDSAFNYTIDPGDGGTLTLSNPSGSPQLKVTNGIHTISAPVVGEEGLTKTGEGTLILTDAQYSGLTTVALGTLKLAGAQLPGSNVLVQVSDLGETALFGTGTIGNLNVQGSLAAAAFVNPASSGIGLQQTAARRTTVFVGLSPGILNTLNVDLQPASNLDMELNGPVAGDPEMGFDQLRVMGTVRIGGSNLLLSVNDFIPTPGTPFMIIDNDGEDPVMGHFGSLPGAPLFLPEGAIFNVNGQLFHITYMGNDGNDVVLTALGPAGVIPEPSSLVLWGVGLLGLCGWLRRSLRRQA